MDNDRIATDRPTDPARVARWAGTLGVAVPALAIPIYPIWLVPPTQTSGSNVALWASEHHDRLVITQVLYTVGVGLWLVFGAAMWTHPPPTIRWGQNQRRNPHLPGPEQMTTLTWQTAANSEQQPNQYNQARTGDGAVSGPAGRASWRPSARRIELNP